MPEEFEGDLSGSVFWGADLRGTTFRDVDLTGTRISHALVVDVEIDAVVERLVVNGVDVTDHVNQHDPWHPVRSMIRPTVDAATTREAWAALEAEWAMTVAQARALPEAALDEQVDGEFSFVQTVRHLVFAIDKWFTAPILGEAFDPMGLPNTGSLEFPWPGLDLAATPSADDALAVLAGRAARFRQFVGSLEPADLDRPIEVLENGATTARDAVFTVLEETFWHQRYARRDLAALAERGSS